MGRSFAVWITARCESFMIAALFPGTLLASVASSGTVADKSPVTDCRCWAVQGQCKDNPRFMKAQCNASCSWYQEREDAMRTISTLETRIASCQGQVNELTAVAENSKASGHASANQSQALQARVLELESQLHAFSHKEATQATPPPVATAELQEAHRQLKLELDSSREAEMASANESRALSGQLAELKAASAEKDVLIEEAEGVRRIQLELRSELQLKDAEIAATKESLQGASDENQALRSRLAELEAQVRLRESPGEVVSTQATAKIETKFVHNEDTTSRSMPLQLQTSQLHAKLQQCMDEGNATMVVSPNARIDTLEEEQMKLRTELEKARAAELSAGRKLKALEAQSSKFFSQLAENATGSEAGIASYSRAAELEAEVKLLKKLLDSAAAAERSASNESYGLQARVYELESQLQIGLHNGGGESLPDSDAWGQLYEQLRRLPSDIHRGIVNLPNDTKQLIILGANYLADASLDFSSHAKVDTLEFVSTARFCLSAAMGSADNTVSAIRQSITRTRRHLTVSYEQALDTDIRIKIACVCISLFASIFFSFLCWRLVLWPLAATPDHSQEQCHAKEIQSIDATSYDAHASVAQGPGAGNCQLEHSAFSSVQKRLKQRPPPLLNLDADCDGAHGDETIAALPAWHRRNSLYLAFCAGLAASISTVALASMIYVTAPDVCKATRHIVAETIEVDAVHDEAVAESLMHVEAVAESFLRHMVAETIEVDAVHDEAVAESLMHVEAVAESFLRACVGFHVELGVVVLDGQFEDIVAHVRRNDIAPLACLAPLLAIVAIVWAVVVLREHWRSRIVDTVAAEISVDSKTDVIVEPTDKFQAQGVASEVSTFCQATMVADRTVARRVVDGVIARCLSAHTRTEIVANDVPSSVLEAKVAFRQSRVARAFPNMQQSVSEVAIAKAEVAVDDVSRTCQADDAPETSHPAATPLEDCVSEDGVSPEGTERSNTETFAQRPAFDADGVGQCPVFNMACEDEDEQQEIAAEAHATSSTAAICGPGVRVKSRFIACLVVGSGVILFVYILHAVLDSERWQEPLEILWTKASEHFMAIRKGLRSTSEVASEQLWGMAVVAGIDVHVERMKAYWGTLESSMSDAAQTVARGGSMVTNTEPRLENVIWDAMTHAAIGAIFDMYVDPRLRLAVIGVAIIFAAYRIKPNANGGRNSFFLKTSSWLCVCLGMLVSSCCIFNQPVTSDRLIHAMIAARSYLQATAVDLGNRCVGGYETLRHALSSSSNDVVIQIQLLWEDIGGLLDARRVPLALEALSRKIIEVDYGILLQSAGLVAICVVLIFALIYFLNVLRLRTSCLQQSSPTGAFDMSTTRDLLFLGGDALQHAKHEGNENMDNVMLDELPNSSSSGNELVDRIVKSPMHVGALFAPPIQALTMTV